MRVCSLVFLRVHNAAFGRMRQNKRTKDDSAHDDGIIDTVNDKKYYEGEEDLTTDMDELIRLVSRLKNRARPERSPLVVDSFFIRLTNNNSFP